MSPPPWAPTERRALALALGFTVMFGLLGTVGGFFGDDWWHRLVLTGARPDLDPRALFDFASGDPDHMRARMARGPWPWWTEPHVKLRMWRPLASRVAMAEWAWFGSNSFAWHAVQTLFAAAFVGAAGLLYRRVLPSATGALALVLFAVAGSHWMPTLWLANQNAVMAGAPMLLGLWLHLRWREDGLRVAVPLSMACYALGLASGEAAIGGFGFVGAYELFGRRGPLLERVAALLPGVLVGAAWAAMYVAGDHGCRANGVYLDPLSQSGDWLLALPGRLLALIGGMTLATPVDLWLFVPAVRALLVGAGLVGLVGAGFLLARAPLEAEHRRALGWLLPGSVLAMLPVTATFPLVRLLLLPSLGGAALLSCSILALWQRRGGGLARVLLALHGPLQVLTWCLGVVFLWGVGASALEAARAAEVPDDASAHRVVVLAAGDPWVALYGPWLRELEGAPRPAAWWVLTMAPHDTRWERVDPHTLAFEADGALVETVFEQLVRGRPLEAGEVFEVEGADGGPGYSVELREASSERTRGVVRFDAPLDDPAFVFVAWRSGRLRKVALPSRGEVLEIPHEPGPARL